MLDIEFLSELVVAHLHGVQNKKDTLDDWYQAYEREYPQRKDAEATLIATLGELLALMPDIAKTRWRKKSDFYSLFLVLARHATLIPFSRDGRTGIRKSVVEFGSAIDRFLADPETPDIPASAKAYARAVERAASDVANRRERHTQLEGLIKDVVDAEQAAAADG
jgi:hypothetical protein